MSLLLPPQSPTQYCRCSLRDDPQCSQFPYLPSFPSTLHPRPYLCQTLCSDEATWRKSAVAGAPASQPDIIICVYVDFHVQKLADLRHVQNHDAFYDHHIRWLHSPALVRPLVQHEVVLWYIHDLHGLHPTPLCGSWFSDGAVAMPSSLNCRTIQLLLRKNKMKRLSCHMRSALSQ